MQGSPAKDVVLTIDGCTVTVPEGTTIWEAARSRGIPIPTLCHDPRLRPVGVCRVCVVDIGARVLAASCVRPCEPGMKVVTSSDELVRHRRMIVDLLASDQPEPCPKESTIGGNELSALARDLGASGRSFPRGGGRPKDASSKVIAVDHQACILCDRCVRACDEVQNNDVIGRTGKGYGARIAFDLDAPMGESTCVSCGECMAACPTGALVNEPHSYPSTASSYGVCMEARRSHEKPAKPVESPVAGGACRGAIQSTSAPPDASFGNRDQQRSHPPVSPDSRGPGGHGFTDSSPRTVNAYPHSVPAVDPRRRLTAVPSVCPYCGVGCNLTYHVDQADNRVATAFGRASPVNDSRLCVKGRYGFDYAMHPQRLGRPLIRRAQFYPKGPLSPEVRESVAERPAGRAGRAGGLVRYEDVMPAFREASWDEALELVASRLSAVKSTHGSGALAGFGSAKCSIEEAYLFQKLVRAVFGTNNVDHCARLCHASSVAALLETIGSGAVTNTFGGIAESDVALLAGTNTTSNHPVAASFFKNAAARGTKLIVVDPRKPDLARYAWRYVRLEPATDVAFYNAMMNVIVTEGLVKDDFVRERTSGFDALREVVLRYTPEVASPLCGAAPELIREVARAYGRARAAMTFWGMGISQHTHGTDNARCLIALCLLTGNVGRPGTGLHPLRGQNNVQGASDAGLIPLMYPDYQRVAEPAVREKFEKAWGVPLDPDPGLTVTEITTGALEGRIKALYCLGENPFLSDPNLNKVREALSRLDFLVVQDIFLTETAEFADVVLPATSYLEKLGAYTSTDRRVQIGRPALRPPGEARLDWQIVCDVATRMGYPMRYDRVQDVFAEFAALTKSYQGLDYELLGTRGRLWPSPDRAAADGVQILFSDGFPTKDGRGKLVPCEIVPAKELPDPDFPLVLNTGRMLEHWHTGTMTRRSQALDAIAPGPYVEMHPDDLAALGASDGETVAVSSRRGRIELPARATTRTSRGSVFIPFHFREAAANVLTIDAVDPFGKIPEYKFCAVKVERAPHAGRPPAGE